MQGDNPEYSSRTFSTSAQLIFALGGALGGSIAMFVVAVFVMPTVYPVFDIGGHLCGASIGVVAGWSPGFVAGLVSEGTGYSRSIGFGVACIAGGFCTAVITIALGSTASC